MYYPKQEEYLRKSNPAPSLVALLNRKNCRQFIEIAYKFLYYFTYMKEIS